MENINGDKLKLCNTCRGEGKYILCTKNKNIIKKGKEITKTIYRKVRNRSLNIMLSHNYTCELVKCSDCNGLGLVITTPMGVK